MRERIIERPARGGRAVGVRSPRAGASCATGSATSRSARSTRSACRCCASSRSRPTSIPASTLADDTEVPRLVDESLDQALRICRGIARERRRRGAGVRAARASGGCARAWRRCSIAGWSRREALRRFLATRPARPRPPRWSCQALRRGSRHARAASTAASRAFLADGPRRHPRSRMLAADLRSAGCIEPASRRPRDEQAAFRVLVDRLRDLLPDARTASRASERSPAPASAPTTATADALETAPRRRRAVAPAVAEAHRARSAAT